MSKLLSGALALLLIPYSYAEERYCLNAITTGNQNTFVQCDQGNSDPLDLKNNNLIQVAFEKLKLSPSLVEFKGCDGLGFRTTNAESSSSSKYLISYSSNTGDKAIAPVIHEIGHVAQLENSNGYTNLSSAYSPNRIELGADYLTGIVFKLGLPREQLARFERNIQLAGIYVSQDPSKPNVHGNPTMRIQAFRLGYFTKSKETDIKLLHQDFQENVYGAITN